MSLTLASLSELAAIRPPLRVADNAVIDANSVLIVGGYRAFKQADCTCLALTAIYNAALHRERKIQPPFSVAETNRNPDCGPYWIVCDSSNSHIWGGWSTREDAEFAMAGVEAIYAAGAAAREVPAARHLQLAGGSR